jgi:hypothetical protein
MNFGMRRFKTKIAQMAVLSVITLQTLNGCNLLSSLDSPSGDAQILAAARACFDAGNFTDASNYYLKLSNGSNDARYADLAFEALAQNGLPASIFMSAVASSSGSIGSLITQLAGQLSYHASVTTRLGIFQAYQAAWNIQNTQSQGVLRFITSLALVAEILSENAATPGIYKQSDLVDNPGTGAGSCAASTANCAGKMTGGSHFTLVQTTPTSSFSGTPTLSMIQAGITEMAASGLQITGSLSSSATVLSTTTTSATIDNTTKEKAFRGALITLGIGN